MLSFLPKPAKPVPDLQMIIVGLTGGIATGKSTVTALLRDHRLKVLDCDEIAHDVIRQVPLNWPCLLSTRLKVWIV